MNCLSSFGGLNTLASFSFADLYPVEHPTTKHFTISQHDLSKTHHHKLKNEIIKKKKSEFVSFDKDLEKKRVQTCFWKNPQGVTSAYKGDCSGRSLMENSYSVASPYCNLYHSARSTLAACHLKDRLTG
jgi:hypothetical protein